MVKSITIINFYYMVWLCVYERERQCVYERERQCVCEVENPTSLDVKKFSGRKIVEDSH